MKKEEERFKNVFENMILKIIAYHYGKVLFLLTEWLFSKKKRKEKIERLDILVKITASNANDQKDHII